MYDYRVTVIKVVDGDTLHTTVDLGCDVTVNLTVRLAGLNAPELPTPQGQQAQAAVAQWIAQRQVPGILALRTIKDRREKYGRYLGTLYTTNTGETLNQYLLDNGFAAPYDGHGTVTAETTP